MTLGPLLVEVFGSRGGRIAGLWVILSFCLTNCQQISCTINPVTHFKKRVGAVVKIFVILADTDHDVAFKRPIINFKKRFSKKQAWHGILTSEGPRRSRVEGEGWVRAELPKR